MSSTPATSIPVSQAESQAQDEIEQIMNEIDALQSQMAEVDAVVSQKKEPPAVVAAAVPPSEPEPEAEPTEVSSEHLPPAESESEVSAEHLPSEESVAGALAEMEAVAQPILETKTVEPEFLDPLPPARVSARKPTAPVQEQAVEEKAILNAFEGQGEEPWLEETMAHLNSEENERSLLEQEQSSGGGALDALDSPDTATDAANEQPTAAPVEAATPRARLGKVAPLKAPVAGPTGSGAIQLTVEGQMTLQLRYAADQYGVTITFSEQGLQLVLEDGTEFKIPVRRAAGPSAA